MRCLSGKCACRISNEIAQVYESAKSVEEVKPEISDLAQRIFASLERLVQHGQIADPSAFGQALAAAFDFCVSLLYADHTSDKDWLYCPKEPYASFYPYIKSCPRCGKDTGEQAKIKAHKPSSDKIGRYASLVLSALLSEALQRCERTWTLKLLDSSRGDIDILLYNEELLVLCELKASPLTALVVSTRHQSRPTKDVNGEPQPITDHETVDTTDWRHRESSLCIDYLTIPLQLSSEISFIRAFLQSCIQEEIIDEQIEKFIVLWRQMFTGYEKRWSEYANLRWFTFGCGGGVDDSKNAPGLDRTDDIKKGLYQSLKLTERYRMGCEERRIRVGIISNLHPVVHYGEYLSGFEDAVWTQESKIAVESSERRVVAARDLSPFYDMLFTFTRSWFRDPVLKEVFSIAKWYRALGGKDEH